MSLRRSLYAVTLAAALTLPVGAFAQKATGPALSFGGGVGMEFGDLDGFGLRVDGIYPMQNLTPELTFAIVGSLGYTHFSEEEFGVEVTANMFKAVPAARFGFAATPQLSVYGDVGLGLYYASISSNLDFGGEWGFDDAFDDNYVGLMMRLAAGALYQVTPRLQVGGELGLNPYFGDYDDNTFGLFLTAVYKM